MDLLDITSAVIWVDFFTIALHKVFNLGRSLDAWYDQFGIVAVMSDSIVIILGILIAKIFFSGYPLLPTAVVIQLIHDILFYQFVILPIPRGHNQVIDLFKTYANENSWKILVADSIMIGSSVLLAEQFATMKNSIVSFLALLGIYALTFVIYTRSPI